MQRRAPENDIERMRAQQLESAVFILRRHLDTLADYKEKEWLLRRKIEDAYEQTASPNSPVILPEKEN